MVQDFHSFLLELVELCSTGMKHHKVLQSVSPGNGCVQSNQPRTRLGISILVKLFQHAEGKTHGGFICVFYCPNSLVWYKE